MNYRCPLTKFQDERPDPEEVKRDGWKEQGILVVSANDPRLDWVQRGFVNQIGSLLYGKIQGGGNGKD